jgi:hypothetical protein
MQIERVAAETALVPIIGTAPLIVNRFPEKAKKAMLDAMQGRSTMRSAKNPDAEYEAAFYRLKSDGGFGVPSVAFKQATIGGARYYDKKVTMTSLRQMMFFAGEPAEDGQLLTRIEGSPQMFEAVVGVGSGHDLRYRPLFNEWSAVLEVTFVKSSLTLESLLSLIDAGGMGVGVGEWRPERKGDYGTYKIDLTKNVEVRS